MKKLCLIVALAMMAVGVNAQTFTLANGKSIPIRLTSTIHSDSKSKIPVQPTAIVDADIKDDSGQQILIRRGAPVEVAANIQRSKGVGKGAYVQLNFLTTTAVDGQVIRLLGKMEQEGKNRKGTALGVGLGVGLTFCWPALFCLCINGDAVTIPENTLINNVVVNDIYQIKVN